MERKTTRKKCAETKGKRMREVVTEEKIGKAEVWRKLEWIWKNERGKGKTDKKQADEK